jgi:ppGpp synthetase/RelA/SpoT-type nucleotidyltranferase
MKLSVIPWSNKEINDAGRWIAHVDWVNSPDTVTMSELKAATEIVSDWRAAYEFPLRIVSTLLRRHIQSFGLDAKVSGRMKRSRSIYAKLLRNPAMKLTTMQDVGGCRAIVASINEASVLSGHFREYIAPKLNDLSHEDDYISRPKDDGYRGIHFVVRYQSKHPELKNLPAKRIEIQIRSLLQHRWATAVETVDLFTGQTLKTGGGDPRWKRFFALASSRFALEEGCPTAPNTPTEQNEVNDEIRSLAQQLQVVDRIWSWAGAMEAILDDTTDYGTDARYLVELDVDAKKTVITVFPQQRLADADSAYRRAERENRDLPNKSAVLVSADSLEEVREAYPGYYGDAKAFLYHAGLL